MINLSKYRDLNGRININLAEDDGIIDIDRNPQNSMIGARTKYWCYSNNIKHRDIMYKKTLLNNYEDFGEVLGFEFAKLIGLPCAEYDFATFDNIHGVITGDIEGVDEKLICGDEILKNVSTLHIIPIQKTCLEYDKIKSKKIHTLDIEQRKKYVNMLIELYNNSIIRDKNIDKIISNISVTETTDIQKIESKLEEYFYEISILYDYGFLGYNSANMSEQEKKQKKEYDDYFKTRGHEISGWNKFKKVVVSNNLLDIWSLIDNYCKINGYSYDENQNIMLELIKMFTYDIILNQGDRHITNWSILLNTKTCKIRFAPIYDNSKICGLDESIEKILQKANAIISFEKNIQTMTKNKIERTLVNIERNINNGTESKLMIDYDDNYGRNNRFLMVEKLLNISSDEVFVIIQNIIDKFNMDNLIAIFSSIEKNKNIKIPIEVKTIVLKTIELNIEKLNTILQNYSERRKVK